MSFRSREEAARLLAARLSKYRGQHPLVLGVPRGAVPMAHIIADAIDGDLDVVLVHKLRAPYQPELAIGGIDETGRSHLSDHAAALQVDAGYLEREKLMQLAELQRRRRLYTPVRPPMDPAGRVVIIVDDGRVDAGRNSLHPRAQAGQDRSGHRGVTARDPAADEEGG